MGTFAPSYFFTSVNIPPPREISLLYYSVGLTTANERVECLVSYVRDTDHQPVVATRRLVSVHVVCQDE